jgi:hypothetical protein
MSEATKKINGWLREAFLGEDIIRLPAVARTVVGRLIEDRETLIEYLNEQIRPLVYNEAQEFAARTRGHVLFGTDLLPRAAIPERVQQLKPRWLSWYEHVGDRHIRLMKMNRQELRAAALLRRERSSVEAHYAALWEAMAERLASDVQLVEEVFTTGDIDALAATLRARWRVRVVERSEEAAD